MRASPRRDRYTTGKGATARSRSVTSLPTCLTRLENSAAAVDKAEFLAELVVLAKPTVAGASQKSLRRISLTRGDSAMSHQAIAAGAVVLPVAPSAKRGTTTKRVHYSFELSQNGIWMHNSKVDTSRASVLSGTHKRVAGGVQVASQNEGHANCCLRCQQTQSFLAS